MYAKTNRQLMFSIRLFYCHHYRIINNTISDHISLNLKHPGKKVIIENQIKKLYKLFTIFNDSKVVINSIIKPIN